jgi:hypothetical protein
MAQHNVNNASHYRFPVAASVEDALQQLTSPSPAWSFPHHVMKPVPAQRLSGERTAHANATDHSVARPDRSITPGRKSRAVRDKEGCQDG